MYVTTAVLYSMIRDVLTTLAAISSRPDSASPTEADLHFLLPDVWLTTHPEATRNWSR